MIDPCTFKHFSVLNYVSPSKHEGIPHPRGDEPEDLADIIEAGEHSPPAWG